MTTHLTTTEIDSDAIWGDLRETQRNVVHFMCFESPLWLRAFQIGLKFITGPYFRQGMRKCVVSERMSEDDLGEHSPYRYIGKNLWPENTLEDNFPNGLPTSSEGKHVGMWPLRITHSGSYKIYSSDFTCSMMPTMVADINHSTTSIANTEKYIIFFKKDSRFARLLGDRVKSVVAEFVHHETFQGYIIYKVLESSGNPLEKYCEWVLEMYFSEGGLQPTTIHMGHIAAELDNDGYEVTYAGYKDVFTLKQEEIDKKK
uniref:Uncharacterized protein LOC100377432 n=1 Tax=Saccoglossus kowalevskii TaxID=10224 RepID=A0ABM0GUD8_SACKO|nr:PREDICTED: uncharacterized protein LOC100377432 [Saccoglossus kowalevskii]